MAALKFKELKNLSEDDRKNRLKELRLELVKSVASAQKSGNSKTKQTKKMIAKILTFNNSKEKLKNKQDKKPNGNMS